MPDPGQVDGRPLTAVDLVDGAVVVLQRPDAHALAGGQPLDLVADLQAARRHRPGDDTAMALDDKGPVDGQAEPLPAPALLDLAADVGEGLFQLVDTGAGLRRGADQR